MPIFVAGPLSQQNDFNFAAFAVAVAGLRAFGYVVLNPFELTTERPTDEAARQRFMRRSLSVIAEQATAIVLLPGWYASEYSIVLARVAAVLGMTTLRLAPQDDGSERLVPFTPYGDYGALNAAQLTAADVPPAQPDAPDARLAAAS